MNAAKIAIFAATTYALASLNPISSAEAAEPQKVEVAALS
jgi:hypothetical protein